VFKKNLETTTFISYSIPPNRVILLPSSKFIHK
jgi:hypothetical protein